jgi:hypothetical protein
MNGCLNTGRDALYRQGNNVMDKIDGPALTKCNDTAIVMAWAAITAGFDSWLNPFRGKYRWQPEDLVDLYFHDEGNWDKFKELRRVALTHHQTDDWHGPYQPERVAAYHQLALREVLGVMADFTYGANFGTVASNITMGTSVILHVRDPGHYVTGVKYNEEKMLIGFKDPAPIKWLQETEDADGNKWASPADFKANIRDDITRAWRG